MPYNAVINIAVSFRIINYINHICQHKRHTSPPPLQENSQQNSRCTSEGEDQVNNLSDRL